MVFVKAGQTAPFRYLILPAVDPDAAVKTAFRPADRKEGTFRRKEAFRQAPDEKGQNAVDGKGRPGPEERREEKRPKRRQRMAFPQKKV